VLYLTRKEIDMKILTLARFYKEQEHEIELKENVEWTEYIFESDDISVANESIGGYSTIELKGCDRQTVAIDWEEMKTLVGFEKSMINKKANYEYQEQ
jgi:hypothetical protein